MQTTVQKEPAIRLGSGIFYVWNGSEYVNLGAIKNAVLNVSKLISEMVFDNAKMSPKSKIEEALFSADMYEIDLTNLQLIDGIADYSTLDGTPVVITDEIVLATGLVWGEGEILTLDNGNGDGSVVSLTAFTNNNIALVDGTDFEVYVENGVTKMLNIKGSDITSAGDGIEATYTYTPNASKTQVYRDIMRAMNTNKFKFVNTDDDGKELSIEFFSGYNRGNLEVSFLSDETTDDASYTPLEIKAFPTDNQDLFQIVDEQSIA